MLRTIRPTADARSRDWPANARNDVQLNLWSQGAAAYGPWSAECSSPAEGRGRPSTLRSCWRAERTVTPVRAVRWRRPWASGGSSASVSARILLGDRLCRDRVRVDGRGERAASRARAGRRRRNRSQMAAKADGAVRVLRPRSSARLPRQRTLCWPHPSDGTPGVHRCGGD